MLDMQSKSEVDVPEDISKLSILPNLGAVENIDSISEPLKKDQVVMVKGVEPKQIDNLMLRVATKFELESDLELHAEAADILGHRKRMSKYYMTVNKRNDYQCTVPHSEGSSFKMCSLFHFTVMKIQQMVVKPFY